MSNPVPPQDSLTTPPTAQASPVQCISGSLIAAALAFALYRLTTSIAQTFTANPITSHNPTAINISAAVRTLVVGMSALGTGIFGLAAFGLMALAIQILLQRLLKSTNPPSNS